MPLIFISVTLPTSAGVIYQNSHAEISGCKKKTGPWYLKQANVQMLLPKVAHFSLLQRCYNFEQEEPSVGAQDLLIEGNCCESYLYLA